MFTGPSLNNRIGKLERLLTASESRIKVLEKDAKDHATSIAKAATKLVNGEAKLIASEAKINLLTTLVQKSLCKLFYILLLQICNLN